jgi:LDH2 family malate/lactate/ureidoglycolate dehydrogenase
MLQEVKEMTSGPDAGGFVRLKRDELTALVIDVLRSAGLDREAAEAAAEILVLADLFGISTHGVDRLPSYTDRMRTGGVDPAAAIGIDRAAPSMIRVDGGNGLGPVVAYRALKACMAAARETGVATAFVRGSNHFGPTIPYTYLAAQQGFASVVASNATTTIAPFGGRAARLGNNPLGIGVPNPRGDPVILDMAMSVVARAKIRRAAAHGEAIPASWATDKDGQPTTNPEAALGGFLLPVGGYKGYGLALMVDLLAGLLSNAAYLTHVSSWADAPGAPQNLGHFILCIDTGRLGDAAWLGAAMQDFIHIVKDTPAAEPDRPVLLPSEIEMNAFRRNSEHGASIPVALVEKLKALAHG